MAGKKQSAKTAESKNLGLSILLALMSFEVIIERADWSTNIVSTGIQGWINYFRGIAIPVFMITAFYFAQRKMTSGNGNEIWDKVLRIIIPIAGWAVIYWIFYFLSRETLGEGREIGFQDFLNLFTANEGSLNRVMWMLVAELILMLVFLLFVLIIPKFHNIVFIVLMVLCMIMQYAGISLAKYVSSSDFAVIVKMLPEMLPLAVIGFLISYYGAMAKTGKWWPVTMLIAVAVIGLLRYFGIFTDITGFGYAGIKILVLATALVFLFAAPPLFKLPKFLAVFIDWLTRYFLGVFCINKLISDLFYYYITHNTWVHIESFTLPYCVIIYLISYIIVLLISLIPCKWTRMLVQNN